MYLIFEVIHLGLCRGNQIERTGIFIERRALHGRYHPKFADFQGAIQEILDTIATIHAEQLGPLLALNFQPSENSALIAA
jgi:hypothetical protein